MRKSCKYGSHGKINLFKFFIVGNASIAFLTRENFGVDTKTAGLPGIQARLFTF